MEDFSQSRGDDDLFDDEIVPIKPSATAPTEDVSQKLENISIGSHNDTISAPAVPQTSSQRGRARGRGPSSRDTPRQSQGLGLADSKFAPKPHAVATPVEPTPLEDTQPDLPAPTQPFADTNATLPQLQPTSSSPPAAPTGPSTKPRPPAVRGDRSLTGGFSRPKLSDTELVAKLAAARQRNQDIAAAHARAQADKESFDERERVARVRREGEERRRRELEVEREGNRRRKMQGTREWDREKIDADGGSRWDERARERRRDGMGESGDGDLREYMWEESRNSRGGGRVRGRRGRGGRAGHANGTQRDPNVSAEQDFPALPVGATPKTAEAKEKEQGSAAWGDAKIKEDLPRVKGTSWADQVEVEGTSRGF